MAKTDLLFHLTIPNDDQFLETVQEVAATVAQHAKYRPQDAKRMAETIAEAVAAAVRASRSGRHEIDLRFDTRDGLLEVSLRYVDTRKRRTRVTLAPGGMETMEVRHHGRLALCRMTRKLPG